MAERLTTLGINVDREAVEETLKDIDKSESESSFIKNKGKDKTGLSSESVNVKHKDKADSEIVNINHLDKSESESTASLPFAEDDTPDIISKYRDNKKKETPDRELKNYRFKQSTIKRLKLAKKKFAGRSERTIVEDAVNFFLDQLGVDKK